MTLNTSCKQTWVGNLWLHLNYCDESLLFVCVPPPLQKNSGLHALVVKNQNKAIVIYLLVCLLVTPELLWWFNKCAVKCLLQLLISSHKARLEHTKQLENNFGKVTLFSCQQISKEPVCCTFLASCFNKNLIIAAKIVICGLKVISHGKKKTFCVRSFAWSPQKDVL